MKYLTVIEMKQFDLIKHIVDRSENSIVVWLFNIGVEKYWSADTFTIKDKKENVIVNHMEEMNLLLTRKQDFMIIRKYPGEQLLKQLQNFSCEIPHFLIPQITDEEKTISELVLEDNDMLQQLKELAIKNEKVYFVPYGVSWLEEKIAETCGLDLIGASSELSSYINSKVFSREVAQTLKYKVTQGNVCHSLDEIQAAYDALRTDYNKVIIKEPYGASGKGMWVVNTDKKLKSVLLILKRFSKNKGGNLWIVEGWIDKIADLNYQVYVSKDGSVETFSVKEQILAETVYIGSVMPPRISDAILKECKKCGIEIGKLLYQKGFNGILGIDALITRDHKLIPIIEINGRFTLSTYVSFIENRFKEKQLFSFYKKLRIKDDVNYDSTYNLFVQNDLWLDNEKGVFCYVSETMNSVITGGNGRLFGIVISNSANEMERVYGRVEQILELIK